MTVAEVIGAAGLALTALGMIGGALLQARAFSFYAGKMDARVENVEKRVDDHDERIHPLETGLAEMRGEIRRVNG